MGFSVLTMICLCLLKLRTDGHFQIVSLSPVFGVKADKQCPTWTFKSMGLWDYVDEAMHEFIWQVCGGLWQTRADSHPQLIRYWCFVTVARISFRPTRFTHWCHVWWSLMNLQCKDVHISFTWTDDVISWYFQIDKCAKRVGSHGWVTYMTFTQVIRVPSWLKPIHFLYLTKQVKLTRCQSHGFCA